MRGFAALIALTVATPVAAQETVTSPGPDSVSVTVYRAPHRGAGDKIQSWRPDGYALVTEKRTIDLPAGQSVIRFEGVAGNIFPETAIVADLPDGVREKNLDAYLLSPRTLYDRALGRSVIIRRTDPATGNVSEEQGIIRSSAQGAMVLQTKAGIEGIGCSGLAEKLAYDSVPPGLSAKPTLSIQTEAASPRHITITLSYLAGGFDWQANYVARIRPDGRGADLTAWITLASSDVTSFQDAGAQVVAGKINRDNPYNFGARTGGGLELKCWPLPSYGNAAPGAPGAPPPPPPPPPPPMMMAPAPIVVMGARTARQEELGDLKLYRIQDRVTVASKAQKQVALLAKEAVPLDTVYVSHVFAGGIDGPTLTLRGKNRQESGLGLALPAGPVAVFEDAAGRDILVGESSTDDKAVGEDFEFKLDRTVGVSATVVMTQRKNAKNDYRLSVTNANAWPIAYEAEIGIYPNSKLSGHDLHLVKKDGVWTWSLMVPANGAATLIYRETLRLNRK